MITRTYADGSKDTYKDKKGPKYVFEGEKDRKPITWDTLQPGESAFGKLKDGPEYDRFAMLAKPEDTVEAVWNQTQQVLRPNAFITVMLGALMYTLLVFIQNEKNLTNILNKSIKIHKKDDTTNNPAKSNKDFTFALAGCGQFI